MFKFTCTTTNSNCSQGSSIPRHIITKLEEVRVFQVRGEEDACSRSPMRHLLKSNATPSDSEIIAIRALISDAEASIDELHRRFPVRDPASQLIESQLLKSIEAHRVLLSPVRYLPSQILQEIFLHYADTPCLMRIGKMPWRLGHISHRWRKFALSLPSLWDNIPRIYLSEAGLEPSHFRALVCLLRRSGSSPTLKLNIICYPFRGLVLTKGHKSLTDIIKNIIFHSERIEQLRIVVSDKTTMHLFQGLKGRLPNLRILRVRYYARAPKLDIFETAPALRQVAIGGSYHDNSIKVLLPWSQITHFGEELPSGKVVPLSSLPSLTNLDIYRPPGLSSGRFDLLSPYRPTTLPNLRTLRVLIYDYGYKYLDLFLESLTIPAVEAIKVRSIAPLIPHLVSMFSGSRGPSRLQKLAFRTIPLQTGELSALLRLTPHLVELDIDIPPAGDLLRLIYGDGEVMLAPMLQTLYIRIPAGAQIEHLDTLAKVRCELDRSKVSDGATMLSLGPGTRTCQWTTLHTLRLVFDTAENRDKSQKMFNNWSSPFSPEEAKAIDMINLCFNRDDIRDESFVKNILSFIDCYEITNKVLHETNLHIELRHYCIGILTELSDEDILKQRAIDLLAEWNQLLLNDFSDGCWARTSSELRDLSFSLVYVSKSKFHEMRMSGDGGLSILYYGLKLSFEDWLRS